MKKILQVVAGLNIGGAETFLMNVLKNIKKEQYEMYFLCYGKEKFDYEEDVINQGGVVIKIDNPSECGYRNHIKQIKEVIKKYNIDIVHAHTLFNSCFSMIAAKQSGVAIRITHSHNTQNKKNENIKDKIYYKISKYFINRYSTDLVACGEDAGKFLFKKDFKVINNGIEIERFRYNKTIRGNLRSELNIKDDETVLIHVGRFFEVKNHKFLIKIFNEYLKLNKNSKLLLAGSGPLEENIKNQVKELKIANKVIFLGLKKNINEYYNVADYFIFPSLFEGLPVVLIETQVNNLNALVSDNIDKNVKMTENINFYSIDDDEKKWANQIIQLKNTRCMNAEKNVEELDIKKSIEKLDEIYKGES